MPLPDVYFGKVDAPPLDWRKYKDDGDEIDNDQELAETPRSTVELLGFDPLDHEMQEFLDAD